MRNENDVDLLTKHMRIKSRHLSFGLQFESASMERLSMFIILLSVVAAQVRAQPSDFIYIDCGIAPNTSYLDQFNGLYYVSDDRFTDTGVNYGVPSAYIPKDLARRYSTVRSFPRGARNCYTFRPVAPAAKYLVRATFLYGNYDARNSPWVQFDLYLGANRWKTINLTDPSTYLLTEAVTESAADVITVCLVNTGGGTPFISALDLRPLPGSLYPLVDASRGLVLQRRTNMGGTHEVRYSSDRYDRLWFPSGDDAAWNVISTDSNIQNRPNDQYDPPMQVMQTAAVPASSTKFELVFPADPGDLNELYAIMYFSELQSNTSRQFFIYFNGALLNDAKPFTPSFLFSDVALNTNSSLGFGAYNISLVAAEGSTLPPLLNAYELFATMPKTNVASDSRDVDAMLSIKGWYQVKNNWVGDPCSPKDYAWAGLNCTFDNSGIPRITALNLSSSGLVGSLATSFANLSAIQYLDLSHNSLTGSIPDALAYLPSLKFLDLTDNQLSGPVPSALIEKSQNGSIDLRIGGNPNIFPNGSSFEPNHKTNSVLIIVIVCVFVTVAAAIAITVLCMLRKWITGMLKPSKSPQNADDYRLEIRKFTYNELENITSNFERVLGGGGFGTVYHGQLENGTQVAVKMLHQASSRGTNDFLSEAQHLTRVHHKNLVSMVGYCMDDEHLALVCEFMSNGTLKECITGTHTPLSWEQRLNIALGAAEGLEYLHTGCKPPLIHRDVKTANILLNERLEAKISDFGMSRNFENDSNTHTTTRVVGTRGYLDPEYYISNQLSKKSDVYSFGVVLLELITGKPAIVCDPEDTHIVEWVRQRLARGNIEDVIDTSLAHERIVNSAWKMANVALACATHASNERPTMTEAVMQLRESLALYRSGEMTQLRNTSRRNLFSESSDTSQTSALEIEHESILNGEGPSAR